MFIVMGGTGHVGSEVAKALLKLRQEVTIVTHDADKGRKLEELGARVAVADILDRQALGEVFRKGERLFMLNPPAPPTTDTDLEERKTIASMLADLDDSGLSWIVAESTYGAQPGDRLGDLSTLYTMEKGLSEQAIPHAVVRAAYYMSNWDAAYKIAREEGIVNTMFPADFKLPMVAPRDIAEVVARLLVHPQPDSTLHHVEGRERYCANDVADAFAKALHKPVRAVAAPRDRWVEAYKKLGFCEAAAQAYARMTAVIEDGEYQMPDSPERGETTLDAYIEELVAKNTPRNEP